MTERFLDLTGRAALVTGAAQGIGQGIARRLARAGARVAVVDRDGAAAEEAARELGGLGLRGDVTSSEDVRAVVARAVDELGALDVVVNNAGITGRAAPLWELGDDDWSSVLAVNLTGVFNVSRAVIGHLRERGAGVIVNVASISGKEGNPRMIPYSTSKAGVIALTKALAKEVLEDGVRVNAVAPGVIATPLLDGLSTEAVEYMRSRVPMGRMGTVEEVAAVVHFLASDDASFVTGQVYDASGGRATY